MTMNVMIADSSAIVRVILEQKLKVHPDVKIIASVSNGKKLISAAKKEKPNVIILGEDITDAAEQESVRILAGEMQIPILLMAAENSFCGKCSGIVENIPKPRINAYTKEFFDSLMEKLNNMISRTSASFGDGAEKGSYKVLCLGASTGGPSAVSEVLLGLGKNFPLPVLYVQHIEVGTDKAMVNWFSDVCRNIRIRLAEDGMTAKAGTVYMAPADMHLVIDHVNTDGCPVLKLSDEEPERFLRPAVNKLFRSAAKTYRRNCLAVLLTGMGADGADGCKEIYEDGGWTIVEDKSTCVVFGMPAAAIDAGGAREVLPRGDIPKRILELVGK